ncbi:MAG: class I SAM-dependent methyltransferase [Candidatus Bathyarchaeia archaeon]
MSDYYSSKLSAKQLEQAYDVASPRIRQYLNVELNHVLGKIRRGNIVLELGCGYGRVLSNLVGKAREVVGVDVSTSSLDLAREKLGGTNNNALLLMDAATLGFRDRTFDRVICIQNGISAFHVDQRVLITESVRVTKPGGIALFSSYSDKFWQHRLDWFEAQAKAGLIGEINHEKTGDGVIVCEDGFTASTVRGRDFLALTSHLNVDAKIVEVDDSSVFCEIVRLAP